MVAKPQQVRAMGLHEYAVYLLISQYYGTPSLTYYGFKGGQIQPFHIKTADHESLYAWLILPTGVYTGHQQVLLAEPSGASVKVQSTAAFQLLREDPQARLVINCKSIPLSSTSLLIMAYKIRRPW